MEYISSLDGGLGADNGSSFREVCNISIDYSWNSSSPRFMAIQAMFIIRIITSSLSILGTGSVILLSLVSGQLANSEVHPIFMLSLADFLVALMWLLGAAVIIQDPTFIGLCYYSGILTTVVEMVSYFLTATYAVIVYMLIREVYNNDGIQLPLKDKRKIPRYVLTVILYIVSWTVPFACVIPLILTMIDFDISSQCCTYCVGDLSSLRTSFRNCTGGIDGGATVYMFDLILSVSFTISFGLAFIGMLVFYVLIMYLAVKMRKKFSPEYDHLQRDGRKLTRIFLRITLFGIIFFLSGLPTLIASVIVWNEKTAIKDYETPDIAILIWQALFAPLQGFLNSIVYGWTRRTFRKLLFCSSMCSMCRSRPKMDMGMFDDSLNKNYNTLRTNAETT